MDRLPQELIAHIASFLVYKDGWPSTGVSTLSTYATLSHKWQLAIETRTFRSLRLTSPELPYFTQVLTRNRNAHVSDLGYDVVLPMYNDRECAKFETKEDKERNSQAFTYAIHALFQFIKTWEADGTGEQSRPLSLRIIDVYSPMDGFHRGTEKYTEDQEQCACGKRRDLFEHRYKHSSLQLLEHHRLPTLSRVSSFGICTVSRHVEPSSAILLANKLPNVQSTRLYLNDNEKQSPSLRQDLRYDFATALPTLSSHSIRDFALTYYYEDPSNEYFAPPSALLPSAPPTDHLSRALYHISRSSNLCSLKLDSIAISPELYWPADVQTPPTWPNLRHHHVEFNMTAPDGAWYFIRDPSKPVDDDEGASDSDDPDDTDPEADTDSDTASSDSSRPDTFNERREARATGDYPIRAFRTLPSDEQINPLLHAMARAATRMPRLESMSLTSTMRDPDGAGFEIYFHAAGQSSKLDSEPGDTDQARLDWVVGSWRPEDEVLKIWQEGREGLRIRFIEW